LQVSVVIPTYNEAENLPKLVSALFALPRTSLSNVVEGAGLPLDLRILVVDDNSPDGTGRIADELAASHPGRVGVLHRPGKLGLGPAYLTGFRKVIDDGAQAVVQMDADFSHDPQAIPEMVRRLESADVVLGSRYVKGGSVDRQWPLWRKGLSAFGSFYSRIILNLPLRDITTGYRVWRSETLKGMPLDRVRSSGYIFQVEMAYLAHLLEFRIDEYPIYFTDRRWGKSKMSFSIQAEAATGVWRVWWQYRDLRRMGRAGRV
jgi:dolichol-phosphate mannosyltransferase